VREEEALGRLGVAHAHVPVSVNHVLVGEDAVRDDQLGDEVRRRSE
jgi:hypothetical protein